MRDFGLDRHPHVATRYNGGDARSLPARGPGRNKDIVAFIAVAVLLSVYFGVFRAMILTEDTGFYGFLARAVGRGAVLHRDIPVATNSIGIYLTAILFRVVGVDVIALRAFHLVGLAILLGAVYMATSRRVSWPSALVATVTTAVFAANPAIMLDLGRNFIYWGVGLIVLGLHVDQNVSRRASTTVASGILFGLGALFRETFIVFAIAYVIYLCAEGAVSIRRGEQRPRDALRTPALFAGGVVLALGVNAALLTANGTWHEYLRAMISSGGSARYQGGMFAPARIGSNLQRWLTDSRHNVALDGPPLLAALLASFRYSGDRMKRAVQFVFVPAALFEALVVNQTFSYHVAPLVVWSSILLAFLLDRVDSQAHQASTWNAIRAIAMAGLVVGAALTIRLAYVPMARRSVDASLLRASGARLDSRVNSYVLAGIADQIPHHRLVAEAQWQVLLLSRTAYSARPFIEDVTAAFNLNRPDLWRQTMTMIRSGDVDLLSSKTSLGLYPQPGVTYEGTDFGRLIAEKYIYLASLGDDSRTDYFSTVKYRDRLMVRRALVDQMPVVSRFEVSLGPDARHYARTLPDDGPFIVIARPKDRLPDGSYSLTTGRSRVEYREVYSSTPIVSSFVASSGRFTLWLAEGVGGQTDFELEVRRVR